MNFVGAVCLLNIRNVEDAFKFFCHLMIDLKLQSLFIDDCADLKLLLKQIDLNIQFYFPRLSTHLKQKGISSEIFAVWWIITLFSTDLPLELVFAILDLYLFDGWDMIIWSILTIISLIEKGMLKMNE